MIAGQPPKKQTLPDPEDSIAHTSDDKPTRKNCMFVFEEQDGTETRFNKIIIERLDGTGLIMSADHAYFQPKPRWHDSTCGDCGYWAGKGKYAKAVGCRKCTAARKNDPACPDFEPRGE